MKALFLDIDGVLNRCGLTPRGCDELEPHLCSLLWEIIQATACRVVVSSTWRKFPRELERLTTVAAKLGIEIKDATPIHDRRLESGLWVSPARGDEIEDWLDQHPEVTRFVILDDDADMGAMTPHLLRTESFVGLTPEIAKEAIRRLRELATP